MRDQVVDRMSIGFQIPAGKSEYDKDEVRHIREVKLLEFSPVTFPMNEAAIITGVKQIEHALRSGVLYEERKACSICLTPVMMAASFIGNVTGLNSSNLTSRMCRTSS